MKTAIIIFKDLPVLGFMKLIGIAKKINNKVDRGSDIRHINSAKYFLLLLSCWLKINANEIGRASCRERV